MPTIELVLFLVLLGVITGVLSAMMGIGGGVISVLPLSILLPEMGVPIEYNMHCAIATSLTVAIFTGISSVAAHQQKKAIKWEIVYRLTPWLLAGAYMGALLATQWTSNTLRIIFAALLVVIGAVMLKKNMPSRSMLPNSQLLLSGISIGTCSAIMGIAGGSFIVPLLTWCSITINRAVATSAACGLAISVTGGISFLYLEPLTEIPNASGYVHWPSFIILALITTTTAPIGARIAHALPSSALRRIFAAFLMVTALIVLINI